MSAADHIKRIRDALSHPHLAEMGDWYSPQDDRNQLCDAALIAACSPEAMRSILGELADRERHAESALAERDRLAAELAKTRAYYTTSQSHAADLGDALRAAQEERDKLAAELEQERAQRVTLQHHATDQAEALRLMTAERDDMRRAHDHLARARRADVAEVEWRCARLCADLRKAREARSRAPSLQPASAETVRAKCRAADPAGEDLCHWSAETGWRAAERHHGITPAAPPLPDA